jgi:putative phage-type endonuclease
MSLQRTEEWFNQRRGRVTGSVAGAILGLSKFKTRKQVLREMVRSYHGKPTGFKGNVATEYGKPAEHNAVFLYEMETGRTVIETGFHTAYRWLGASPDGIVYEGARRGVLEIKCPYAKYGTSEFGEILPEYYAQVQVEMRCARADFADFMQWSPQGYVIKRIEYDRAWMAENLMRLYNFWKNEFLPALELPNMNEDEAILLAEEYKNLAEVEKSADKRKKEILATLTEMTGGKPADIGKYKLTQVEREGSVDYKKVVEENLPDVDTSPYKKAGSSYWRLS